MGSNVEKNYDTLQYLKEVCVSEKIESPKVSIIVPTYNNAEFLEKCLFSLIKQTLKEIEIIIVNDASTDNTDSILNLFSTYDKRIKVINHDKIKKQGAARNTGTNAAIGEYIGYVDSDDWIDLEYYEKLYTSAKKYNSDIALATNIRVGGNKKNKKRLNIEQENFVTTLQDKIDVGNQAKNPCPTNKIYRRKMLEDNNIVWPEGVYCEDKLFTIQAIYYANGVVSVPNLYYYYFRNPNSTVNSIQTNKHKLDKNNANLEVLRFLKDNGANIRDKDFWAITKYYPNKKFVLLTKKESLKTAKYYLFGVIKLLEKEI